VEEVAQSLPEPTTGAAASWRQEPERRIEVQGERFHATLTSRGGGLLRWELLDYSTRVNRDWKPVELSFRAPEQQAALVTPLRQLGLGDLSEAPFQVKRADNQSVVFEFRAGGVRIRKTYHFEPDSYLVRLQLELWNESKQPRAAEFGLRWPAVWRPGPDYESTSLVAHRQGAVEQVDLRGFGKPGFFGSVGGREPERVRELSGDLDWAGVQTNYFIGAVLPDAPREAEARFEALEPGREAAVSIGYPAFTIPPGHSGAREFRLYLGPKQPERLEAVGASLRRSISLGWSWVAPLTRLFIWLLDVCHAVIPNYGLAIILLTVLVRLVTAPLMAKQMRSMKRLGEIQPQLRALQEKHADDRQRQSQEVMKLMRQAGANPLGGCLPMLFQFPFLIGLFWALQSSIKLRQAPFVAWIQDLSAPESLFTIPGLDLPLRVLPLVMGGSMVLQQRLTPSTMDPSQARMMTVVMPVMLTLISYRFPSGLVLYWFVSNLLAIGHQTLINRRPGKGKPPAR
jgi:YidC/Oxa1 family membrane protein insertase